MRAATTQRSMGGRSTSNREDGKTKSIHGLHGLHGIRIPRPRAFPVQNPLTEKFNSEDAKARSLESVKSVDSSCLRAALHALRSTLYAVRRLTSAATLHASRFFPGRFTDIMSIPMGPHGRWVARHLQDTVCGAAQRAGVDRQSLNKFARGMPKVMGDDREEAVYRVYRLTPRQFAWNVKVGWHGKKSYEPAGRKVVSGQLSVGSGRGPVNSGQRAAASGQLSVDSGRNSKISVRPAVARKSAIPNLKSKISNFKSEIPARPAGGRNPQSEIRNRKPEIGFNREAPKAFGGSSDSVKSVKSVDSSRLPAFAVRSSIRNPKPAGRNPKSEIENRKSKIPPWLCRPDLCRLSGRCPAARRRDFSGRTRRACTETEKRK